MAVRTGDRVALNVGRARLEVCPEQGGVVTAYAWEVGGRRFDWLRPAPDAGRFAPTDAASFPLVPISNRVRDGRYRFEGRDYQMALNFPPEKHAIHGHGWQAPWSVASFTDDTITLAYGHAAGDWPSAYEATQTFRLDEETLSLTMSVRNVGDRAMPAGIGPHPYFVRTPQASVTAPVSQMWTGGPDVMPVALVDLPADRNLRAGVVAGSVAMDNLFTGFGGEAVIAWPEWQASLALRADPVFAYLVVFTPPGEDFFCVEPVSNATDALTMLADGRGDGGLRSLEPGQELAGTVTFTPNLEG